MPSITLGPLTRSFRGKMKLPPGVEDPELKNFFVPGFQGLSDVDAAIAFFLKKAETSSENQASSYIMAARACRAKHMGETKNAKGEHVTIIGDPKRAEIYYRKALETDPRSFPALTELADMLSGKNPEGAQLMERAALVKPHPYFLMAVGDFYRDVVKNDQKAYEWYIKSHDASPSVEVRRKLTVICKKLGK